MAVPSIPTPFSRKYHDKKENGKKKADHAKKSDEIEPGLHGWETKKIRPNPDQPRKYFDPATMAGLRKSISLAGILNPPFVSMPDKDGFVDLIDGERRLRAALELKMDIIPVFIGEADKEDAFLVSVVSNFCREQTTEIEDAMAIKRLQDEFELSVEYIADLVGKSVGWVYNRLKYLKLHPDLARELQNGKISPKLALSVTSYPEQSQKKILRKLQELEEEKSLSPQQTTRQVARIGESLKLPPAKTKHGTRPLDYATKLVMAVTSGSSKLSNDIDEVLSNLSVDQLSDVRGEKLQNLDFELKKVLKRVKEAQKLLSKAF
jgi:ParB family transcriptional regulator, chromosome partitioning protein